MPEPDALIRAILDVESDPWLTQVLFAARCVAESHSRVSDDTASRVVRALLDRGEVTHLSDVRRQHAGFALLVRNGVMPAVSRALEICQKGMADQKELYLEVVCALAELGHEDGLHHAQELLSAQAIPRRHRERLITALTATEDPAALDLIVGELHKAGRSGDLDAFLAALKPQSDVLLKTAVRLLRTREFIHSARVAVAAALLECGRGAVAAVLDAARDPTLEWGLRCRLIALLIKANESQVTADTMTLLQNPNVRAADRSYVVEAMIHDGQFSWLTLAAGLLVDADLPWDRQATLAATVRDIGVDGIDLLFQQLTSGLPLRLTVRHLVALVEIHDQRGLQLAVPLSLDEGVPIWIRATILWALLEAEPSLVNVEAALQVIGDPRLRAHDRLRLSVALARAGIREAQDAVRAVIDGETNDLDWPLNSRLLATSGPTGRTTLTRISTDDNYSWYIRIESLLALGATQGQEAPDTLPRISLEGIPELWRNRLIFGLTAAGNSQFAAELVRFLPTVTGAYEVFHQFMHGPNASLELFFDSLGPLIAAMSDPMPDGSGLALDEELLLSCGLTWNSDSERDQMLSWFYRELELRVGLRLAKLMMPHQLAEFESYIRDDDEKGAFDWLITIFPEYQGFTKNEFDRLKVDIIAGRTVPPQGILDSTTPNQPVLETMKIVLARLHELVGFSVTGQWADFFRFFDANKKVLLTSLAEGFLRLAVNFDPGWPLHEAHLFLLHNVVEQGIDTTSAIASDEKRLLDRLVQLLDEDRLEDVYLGGAFGALRFERSAACRFYAAVGAAGVGLNFAHEIMYGSGKRASEAQTTQGLATIQELARRLNWEPAIAQGLLDALSRGRAEAVEDRKDDVPGS
jgi:hypothetical protein